MTINLTKGVNINLTKEAPSLVKVMVGLGWKPKVDGDVDLDALVLLLNSNGKLNKVNDVIFFNNKVSDCKSTYTEGDDVTGEGDGDDEVIHVDLSKVPADITKLVFAVTIYQSEERKQNFGQISDAYIRIVDEDIQAVIAQYDLDEDASGNTSLIFGELYRNDSDWKFKAIGTGITIKSLSDIITLYS